MPRDVGQAPWRFLRGQNEIHHAGGDGAARHAVEFGGFILGEGDAPFGFDGPQSERAVRGRAGEDHSDRIALPILRQRAEK